jgi:hypothetical protein
MNNPQAKYYWIGALVLAALVVGGIYFTRSSVTISPDDTPGVTTTPSVVVNPYGIITLKLGETGYFRGIAITPLTIEEDSRCPKNVQCVWAGTVKVAVRSDLDSGSTFNNMVTLGETTIVDTFGIKLSAVTPEKTTATIATTDYRLTFEVHQSAVVDNELIGK